MFSSDHPARQSRKRRLLKPHVEALENRIALSAASYEDHIDFNEDMGAIHIAGTNHVNYGDWVEITETDMGTANLLDDELIVYLRPGTTNVGRVQRFNLYDADGKLRINRIDFHGFSGSDYYKNVTDIRSVLYGGRGSDHFILEGDADDLIFTDEDGAYVNAGRGDDTIWGWDSEDHVVGGDGNDEIHGRDGSDILVGGAGDDRIWGHGGNDHIDGEDGADSLYGGEGRDSMIGGDGSDFMDGGLGGFGGGERMYGGRGGDTMYGSSEWDIIYGDEDNDIIYGRDGSDDIYGGEGNDDIYTGYTGYFWNHIDAGPGEDRVYGGPGNDYVLGGDDDDFLDGGAGDDTLNGGDGEDVVYGNGGNDRLIGGRFADFFDGGTGFDTAEMEQGYDSYFSVEAAIYVTYVYPFGQEPEYVWFLAQLQTLPTYQFQLVSNHW